MSNAGHPIFTNVRFLEHHHFCEDNDENRIYINCIPYPFMTQTYIPYPFMTQLCYLYQKCVCCFVRLQLPQTRQKDQSKMYVLGFNFYLFRKS